jgi:hypothetical protein
MMVIYPFTKVFTLLESKANNYETTTVIIDCYDKNYTGNRNT